MCLKLKFFKSGAVIQCLNVFRCGEDEDEEQGINVVIDDDIVSQSLGVRRTG